MSSPSEYTRASCVRLVRREDIPTLPAYDWSVAGCCRPVRGAVRLPSAREGRRRRRDGAAGERFVDQRAGEGASCV
eukprot:806409-Prorocentrum_minimum.AAC.1